MLGFDLELPPPPPAAVIVEKIELVPEPPTTELLEPVPPAPTVIGKADAVSVTAFVGAFATKGDAVLEHFYPLYIHLLLHRHLHHKKHRHHLRLLHILQYFLLM